MIDDEKQNSNGKKRLNYLSTKISIFDIIKNYQNSILIFIIIIIIVLLFAFGFYIIKNKYLNSKSKTVSEQGAAIDPIQLPDELKTADENNGNGRNLKNTEIENLYFGDFYQKPKNEYDIKLANLSLPLDSQKDVINFFDLSRKIDLDPKIDDLNAQGFVILENALSAHNNNFIEAYRFLQEKNVPLLITSDYLLYYYQNNLKKIYKKIEGDVFYYSIWDTGNKLFDIADNRYRARYSLAGLSNNTVLEGQRLEAAYLAVLLKLLSPQKNQVDLKNVNKDKFDSVEAETFEFTIPAHLKDDVEREMEFIYEARGGNKSPVLRYDVDYSRFEVPKDYQKNAKLYNFYLASEWLNLSFPLYFQSEECPDCLLDKDYWMINLAAAGFLTKDLIDNDELKLKWAKIYKIMAYFKGLRNELTILEYHKALKKAFGEDYDLEQIFDEKNSDKIKNFTKLQEEISSYNFEKSLGGLDRNNPELMPRIGMKVLQDFFWPSDYIFSQLTYPSVGALEAEQISPKDRTTCQKNKVSYRCVGSGLDLISLVTDLPADYYLNTSYENFNSQYSLIAKDLDNFNLYNWHSNGFWSTMFIAKEFLNYENKNLYSYYQNDNWKSRQINSILGGLLNLETGHDSFDNISSTSGLSEVVEVSRYNYIEPDLILINEILAEIKMLSEMIGVLELEFESPTLNVEINNLISDFSKIKEIAEKEIKGEALNDEDCYEIRRLVNFNLNSEGEKNINSYFGSRKDYLIRSIDGVKLLGIIRPVENGKVLMFGPIFNYQETPKFSKQ